MTNDRFWMILTSVAVRSFTGNIFSVELWQVGQVLHLLMALLMQRTAKLPAPHLALLSILPSLSLSLLGQVLLVLIFTDASQDLISKSMTSWKNLKGLLMMPSADHHFAKTPDTHTHGRTNCGAAGVNEDYLDNFSTTWSYLIQIQPHEISESHSEQHILDTDQIKLRSNLWHLWSMFELLRYQNDVRMISGFILHFVSHMCRRLWQATQVQGLDDTGPAWSCRGRVHPGPAGLNGSTQDFDRRLVEEVLGCWMLLGYHWESINLSIYQSINPSTNININQSNQSNQSLDWFTGTF